MCVGNISRWGEVKKKTKDRSQSKAKEATPAAVEASTTSVRGGRGRGGSEAPRGRGRGSDRGRGTTRGGRAGSTANGTRNAPTDKSAADSTPSAATSGWDEAPNTDGAAGNWDQVGETDTTPLESSWEHVEVASAPASAPAPEQPKPLKPDGTRSWASMFSKPAPAPVQQKVPQQTPLQEAEIEPPAMEEPTPVEEDMPGLPPPIPVDSGPESLGTPPASSMEPSEPTMEITPSKDLLTETNLEQLPDVSEPAPVATAASTADSTIDQRTIPGANTPLNPSQQPAARPPMGGFATSAYKATGGAGRSASYNRRLAEQQEAVVMPGKQSVDRAAVQFGSMGLNGTAEDGDVDSDREEPETRAQPPQHSPIAPRASLPPASQASSLLSQPPPAEPLPTPRQAPGLPPVGQQPPTQASIPEQATQSTQSGYPYNQYGRYGTQPTPQESAAPTQKPYEPFGSQIQQHQQHDGYPSTSQPPSHGQPQQAPSQLGGYSSAPSDMASYYTSDNQRNAYQNYYNNYAQQPQSQQESGTAQQRVGSAFGTSASEQAPQYATSHQPPSRYGPAVEAQTSGQSTPNPSVPNQALPQTQPGHPMHQQQGQAGGQAGGYPYGHPSYAYGSPYGYYNQHVSNHPYGRERPPFDDVRRYDDQYLTHNPQFGYGGNQAGYGGGPFGGGAAGKQGMYGQPQGYSVNPQTAYDQHSASPANVGGFGHHAPASREGPTSAGLGTYGRTASTQQTEGQQGYGASGGYGSMPDVFGRSQSGYPGSNHPQQGSQQGAGGNNEDSLRAYDSASKGPGGPSPALGQPGVRPGSAVSGMPNAPPQGQGQSQGYGGYPGHHQMHGQQASQYGAAPGGLGGHHQSGAQSHQGSGYGGYGAGFGSYYGNNRGGWGGSYGH